MGTRAWRLLAAAVRALPASRRELGEALVAEATAVPPGWRRLRWLAGGAWFVLREGVMRRLGYGLGLLAALAALVIVDRIGRSDDAGQVSMMVLLAGAGALGYAAPRRAWLPALALGSALAVAEMTWAALGLAPAPHVTPGGVAGAATLFVLLVPATVAAAAGAGIRWLARKPRGRRG
jgi:hypothetical protein